MKSYRFISIWVIMVAGLLVNNLSAREAVILYINTGVQAVDQSSREAVELMTDELNEGGTTEGWHYTWVAKSTFEEAYAYYENRPQGVRVFVVCHGVFTPEYSGNLDDSKPDSTPEEEVKARVPYVIHCSKANYLDQTDIGRIIAHINGHNYGLAGVSVGTGSTGSHLQSTLIHLSSFSTYYFTWQLEDGGYMPPTFYYYY